MTSAKFKRNEARIYFTCLVGMVLIFSANACTVKRDFVQPGTIPKLAAPSPGAEKYGNFQFQGLRNDYDLDAESRQHDKLVEVFNELAAAAEIDHLPWHVYLFKDSEIADIRAVHGNYIFVWSGIMDAVETDDEFAGLLACELSHVLAHHTDPVEFTLASEILFSATELATTLGLMVASHGAIAIVGSGWLKWAYVEAADLDPMDREYSEEKELEAAGIALLIVSRSRYSPQALLDFWQRVANDESLSEKYERLSRSLSPQPRVAMLENAMEDLPADKKLAKKPLK